MRGAIAGMLVAAALAGPVRAAEVAPLPVVMLFAPGSAEIGPAARVALLAFLRPARPPAFRGHCIAGHADRGPGAAALSRARAEAVAAMMRRQGVDPRDVAVAAHGANAPARLAPAGEAEPMNDRVELIPCPGPRLAGDEAAAAMVLDAAVLPGYVAALAPRIARALGCAEPEVPRGSQAMPALDCPPGVAAPVVVVRRLGRTRGVAVELGWPLGMGAGEVRRQAIAAAGAVLDLFGIAPAPLLASSAGPAPAAAVVGERGARAEILAGPGLSRAVRVTLPAPDRP